MSYPPSGIRSDAFERTKTYVVYGLMMAVALAALEATVVGTVAPTIAGELGGLRLFSWVFSIYLLTSTVTVPIYGKLADLYGRKPVIVFGVSLFLIGSMLCGLAQSMEMLIGTRAIQGLGAGAVLPIAITIIGDLFTIEERARIQGLFSGVWGVAGIAGPAAGGLITDNLGWPFAFFINVPFGLLSLALILRFYAEQVEKKPHTLDYLGALLLSGSIVALLMALLQGVGSFGWTGVETLAMFGTSAVLLGLFVRQELRAPEPVIPLSLFRNRVILVSSLAVFVAGGLMFGVSSYVPLFEQGVFGGSATRAGLVLAPMSLAWVISAIVSGKLIIRVGYYPAALTGGISLFAGSLLLLGLTADTTILIAVGAGLILGVGMGSTTNSTLIAVQNAVAWNQRGVATASTQFFRTIGGAIGVAIMGAILTSAMTSRLAAIPGVPEGASADNLLTSGERAKLPAGVLDAMQRALAGSLHEIFYVVVLAAVAAFAIVLFFPRGRAQDMVKASPDEGATTPAGAGRERPAFGASEGS